MMNVLHFKRMLKKISRHSLRIIGSPALILLYLSLPFQSFSQKVPCRTFKSSWMFFGSIVELMGEEEMRRFDLKTLWCVRHYKAEWSEWGGSRGLEISTDLSVLDSFVWLFLSSMASCDTRGMVMNITGALMSVINSRLKRCCEWDCEFLIPPSRFSSHSCGWVLCRCQTGHARCWFDDWGHRHLSVKLSWRVMAWGCCCF